MVSERYKTGRAWSGASRTAIRLSSSLEKAISAYSTAALAAGVGIAATTTSAAARIIYTPAHTKIAVNDRMVLALDLNHDGIADFRFQNQSIWGLGSFCTRVCNSLNLIVGCAPPIGHQSSGVCNEQNNMIWGQGRLSGRFASALPAGYRIGPNKSYFQQALEKGSKAIPAPVKLGGAFAYLSGPTSSQTSGQWLYTRGRYLGLQFVVNGQFHYGWARLSVPSILPNHEGIVAVLTGYAYETIPNKAIIAGKTKGSDVITVGPGSLGALAAGRR